MIENLAVFELKSLKCEEQETPHRWQLWTEKIGIPNLSEKLNSCQPYVYWSAEYGCPGLGANGGLGMLSRDHFLQATDLGFPGYFIGLAYGSRKEQKIEKNEHENYYQSDQETNLPSPQELGMDSLVNVDINLIKFDNNTKHINVYKYPLSTKNTNLFLLQVDGEVYPKEPNSDERLWNDVVLGMGGFQIIKQLQDQGIIKDPSAYHLNESATVLGALSALDNLVEHYGNNSIAYEMSLKELRSKTILTNHTLVPAAEANYSREQCQVIFNNLKSDEVKSQLQVFISQRGGKLSMLDLSLYLAGHLNCVSKIHAEKANTIFKGPYGEYYYGNKVEFKLVTNGIYEKGWNSDMVNFLEKHQVIDEFGIPNKIELNQKVDQINNYELFDFKSKKVEELRQYLRYGKRLDQFGNPIYLPENATIIGDARRFAGYKRRWMMFVYPDKLQNILINNPQAHILISGKAHPHDEVAKRDLSFVLNSIASNEIFRRQIHYLPDWDTELAKKVGPACHAWLNTPDGNEASGTSGMKTGIGGALQVSTVDGFYAELEKSSFYAIEGKTNSEEEFNSYYNQVERAIDNSKTPEIYSQEVKKLWKGGILEVASGSRFIEDYTKFIFSPEQTPHLENKHQTSEFKRFNLEPAYF